MPAPLGNKYGEKWPQERAMKFIEEAIEMAIDDDNILFVGEITKRQNLYDTAYAYLAEKYEEFDSKKKTLLKILAKNIARKAIDGETNATMSIFVLKNNHGWRDRRDVDLTSQGEKIAQNVFLLPDSDEE